MTRKIALGMIISIAASVLLKETAWSSPFNIFGRKKKADACIEALSGPISTIPHTPQKIYPNEIEATGTILWAEGQALAHLQDGEYVFLITASDHVIYSARYLLDSSQIATHKSLLNQLRQAFGDKIRREIIGSGEFTILNGQAWLMTNRSGNFKGNEAHFENSKQLLAAAGLPLLPRTLSRIIGPLDNDEKRGHTPRAKKYEAFQLELRLQFASDPEMKKLLDTYTALYKSLYRRFPDKEEAPGSVDTTPIINADLSVAQDLLQVVDYTQQVDDGPYVALAWLIERRGLTGALSYIQEMERLLHKIYN